MSNLRSLETVSSAAVFDLLDTCIAMKLIGEHDLKELDINRATLGDPSQRLPEKKLITLWNLIAQNAAQPNIGLLIGQTINPSAKGLLASWVSQTGSIGEALEVFSTNICLMNPSEHWEITLQNDQCVLNFNLNADKLYPSIAIERSMSAMITWGRVLSAHPLPVTEVHFTFSAPIYADQFPAIFGTSITFSSNRNSISFDQTFLTLPISSGNHFLKSLLEDKAKETIQTLAHSGSMTAKTTVAIKKILLEKNTLSIDEVCAELAVSRQTLYRKLKDEGADYKTLSDDYRKSEALKLLQAETVNITGIGLRLGYKDTSSFYKAFKRWFGMSPKTYLSHIED